MSIPRSGCFHSEGHANDDIDLAEPTRIDPAEPTRLAGRAPNASTGREFTGIELVTLIAAIGFLTPSGFFSQAMLDAACSQVPRWNIHLVYAYSGFELRSVGLIRVLRRARSKNGLMHSALRTLG